MVKSATASKNNESEKLLDYVEEKRIVHVGFNILHNQKALYASRLTKRVDFHLINVLIHTLLYSVIITRYYS